jgi:polyribonucleotide nucleotidyltransferase
VKTIAAVANGQIIWLFLILVLSAPNCKYAQHHTFVGDRIQIIELRPHIEIDTPRIQTIQIDPSQIGLLIGKGGETIRGLQDEFDAQIDVNDDGHVLVYSSNGEMGEALAERIRSMTKEVEVGDEFTGKVVKTTTFGAFVELTKGTDGLLHISNVKPGERVGAVEDVLSQGDELEVTVVEVDRERGRIGLRLSDDPSIEGKTAEDLASVGTGDPTMGGGGGRRDGGRREGGGGRGRERLDGGRRGGGGGRDRRPDR